MVLEAKDLSFSYGKMAVFSGLDFSLAAGMTLGILGVNGAGKSTCLELICGAKKPKSGRVLLCGKDLNTMTPRERGRTLAYVPQSEHYPFDLAVTDFVLMGRTAHVGLFGAPSKQDEALALAALEAVGTGALARRRIKELSGGQMQLVRIARGVVAGAKILVLDEPSAHLDLHYQDKIFRAIKALNKKQTAVILSSHDPDSLLGLADSVLILGVAQGGQGGQDERCRQDGQDTHAKNPNTENPSGYLFGTAEKMLSPSVLKTSLQTDFLQVSCNAAPRLLVKR
ncbi:MAG: ABC transporter ATP-binding protein [Helicobacteraceae bacterium]